MNIEQFREYCLSIKGSSESLPLLKKNILAFKVKNKMFAYISLEPKDGVFKANLKYDSQKTIQLRENYQGISYTDFKKHYSGI